MIAPEAQTRLRDVERRHREAQERLSQVRKKEQLALLHLRKIQAKLNLTTGALRESKSKLQHTETKLDETERGLRRTKSSEELVSEQAGRRLREIYEGQRLSLLEMFFQVDSLTALLDLFYYQERVAESDRKLLEQLRAQEAALAARKNKLGEQRLKLGDLVSEFARKALMISREKLTQEQIAEKLRNQREFYEKAERQLARESQQLEQQILDMESSNKRSVKDMAQGSGHMTMPLRAGITSPFGWRRHPIFGLRKFHTGIDLAGPNHAAIAASDSGNVLYTGWYGGYGRVVIVSHGKGMSTLYAHLSRVAVSPGQNVKKGDIIGYEGTTGFSTGPHLHFEVRVNGKPNNPLNFVK
jgi:murein DD-endopeptidase MepM/ murein hydrolase activator NlpD